jgi:Mg-chelatase subunit ChlI
MSAHYPFAAIVGQDQLKTGLILNVIDPSLSGILIRGEKGTAKSTAVRALADLLPPIHVVRGCAFNSSPEEAVRFDLPCLAGMNTARIETEQRPARVVELPISATEDRVIGTLDLEHAIKLGEKRVEPGILAAAHRAILYVDEVNLLDDHVVDVLLDSAAMGVNSIEREGVSFTHPSRFTLVGTMNPEEGELRPQLLDRFGLCVHLSGLDDIESRVEVMRRRADYDADPDAFAERWTEASRTLAEAISIARERVPDVDADQGILRAIAERAIAAKVDGHRADIVMLKCATALAAWKGRDAVALEDLDAAAEFVLPHRTRRLPFEDVIRA